MFQIINLLNFPLKFTFQIEFLIDIFAKFNFGKPDLSPFLLISILIVTNQFQILKPLLVLIS